ncbi:hypothetical protein [Lysinibacillus fusiformis]
MERNTGEATRRCFACVTNIVLAEASTNGMDFEKAVSDKVEAAYN